MKANKLRTLSEVYEHPGYGEIVLTWLVGGSTAERRLVAVQPGVFVPAAGVGALLGWGRELPGERGVRESERGEALPWG